MSRPDGAKSLAVPAPDASLADLARTFAKVGLLSFGGAAAQIAWLHRIAVDERGWVKEREFLHALNYCMLLPGPEAQQLATYIGWLRHGLRGGLVAGALFVIPGALVMLLLSAAYALYADLAFVAAAFFGVKAAVLMIVVEAVLRIGRRALTDAFTIAVAAAAFAGIFAFGLAFPLIVLGAGLAGLAAHLVRRSPPPPAEEAGKPPSRRRIPVAEALAAGGGAAFAWALPPLVVLAALGGDHVLASLSAFFSKLAVVTFGGAYAVLAYLAQAAVETHAWVTPEEMLDGLGLAETTPGPTILVNQFVGFLAAYRAPAPFDPLIAGVLGAALTTWVTFIPSYLWIFLGAPFIERLRNARMLNAVLGAITAAVVGVILNLALWFGLHVLFRAIAEWKAGPLALPVPQLASLDLQALALGLVAAFLLFRLRAGVAATVGLMAALGLGLRLPAW